MRMAMSATIIYTTRANKLLVTNCYVINFVALKTTKFCIIKKLA